MAMPIFGQVVSKVQRFEQIPESSGLSQHTIHTLIQDSQGLIWVGTSGGMNRYDGQSFRAYTHDPADPTTLPGNHVLSIVEDPWGFLWVGTYQQGMARFDPRTGKCIRIPNEALPSIHVRHMKVDRQQRLWLGTDFGLAMIRLQEDYGDAGPEVVRQPIGSLEEFPWQERGIGGVFQDAKDRLWFFTYRQGVRWFDVNLKEEQSWQYESRVGWRFETFLDADDGQVWLGTAHGLFHFEPETKKVLKRLGYGEEGVGFPTDLISQLVYTNNRKGLWVGSRIGGLFYLDLETGKTRFYTVQDDEERNQMPVRRVSVILEDRSGVAWFATERGLWRRANQNKEFRNYGPDKDGTPAPLNVQAMTLLDDETLVMGTMGEGLYKYDLKEKSYKQYLNVVRDYQTLGHNIVWDLLVDSQGRLLICHLIGLGRYRPETDDFVNYGRWNGLEIDSLNGMHEAPDGKFWLASWGQGVLRIDLKDNRVDILDQYFYKLGTGSEQVYSVKEDSRGRLWVGTVAGLSRVDENHVDGGELDWLSLPVTGDARGPSNSVTVSIFEDAKQRIWLCTRGGGLNRYDEATGQFIWYTEKDGLPSNTVFKAIEDDQGFLWLSTDAGLCRFDPETGSLRTFDRRDGLHGHHFERALVRHPSGEIFVGGFHGFNSFFPERIGSNPYAPALVITGVESGLGQFNLPNRNSVSETISLDYRDDYLAINYAALDFHSPERNRYAYKMEGYDEEWRYTDAGKAVYTDLPSGYFRFRIKGSNSDGVWNTEGTDLKLHVSTPPWATPMAYFCYLMLGLVLLYSYGRWMREHKMVARLQQLDHLKDEILANTSHELRTPLHGVMGIVESLLEGNSGELPDQAAKELQVVLSSGKRLANLVGDILDISQLKTDHVALESVGVDLRVATDVVFSLCKPLIGGRDLKLVNHVEAAGSTVLADEERLQQILFNLVGNGIKFTESGEVAVSATQEGGLVWITVRDTGIGIPKDKHEQIFEAFQQADREIAEVYGGTGLGLAITARLVSLHGGTIQVQSEPGEGAAFRFSLPLADAARVTETRAVPAVVESGEMELPSTVHEGRFHLLVVDDEPVNRHVLMQQLGTHEDYRVSQVPDGPSCLAFLEEHDVDLVLLDLMMPRMSGLETCRRVREKVDFVSLPIIFLTAKNQIKDLAQAFAQGANDYLSKPINKKELLARVEMHLQLLEVNRTLEQKVVDRTAKLAEKNAQILRTQKRLIMQEKMAFLGSLATGMAHELQNPLNFVNNGTQLLGEAISQVQEQMDMLKQTLSEEQWEELSDTLEDINDSSELIFRNGDRAQQIVKSLMAFSKERKSVARKVAPDSFIQKYVKAALASHKDPLAASMEPVWQLEAGEEPHVLPEADLSGILGHLVHNAVEACVERAQREPDYVAALEVSSRLDGDILTLAIKDNGAGVKEGSHDLFSPFFTTKTNAAHIGLGLSLCCDIIQGLQGDIRYEPNPEGGMTFFVRLPLNAAELPN